MRNRITSAPKVQPASISPTTSVAPIAPVRLDLPTVSFARLPHALAADKRLTPTDRLVAAAVMFWACDRTSCEMSNAALGDYVGVAPKTAERSLHALARLGYVAIERVRPTSANMTGRVVRLRWIDDPSVLPAPPSRSRLRVVANPGTETIARTESPVVAAPPSELPRVEPVETSGEAQTPASHPLGRSCPTPPDTSVPPPGTLAPPKEDRPRRTSKISKTAEAEALTRQRPQADSRAVAEAETYEPPSTPGEDHPRPCDKIKLMHAQDGSTSDDLTPGQREAIAAMTDAERAELASKPPSRRASLLAPFKDGFEPRFFETITRRELKPPRFLASPKPVDGSTPNLVAAVADGDPRYVPALAEALCRDFGGAGDRRRWGAIHRLAQQLHQQVVTPEELLDAHRQAMGPKAENRGAVFTTALRRLGWTPDARPVSSPRAVAVST